MEMANHITEMKKWQIAISSSSERDKGTIPKDTPGSESESHKGEAVIYTLLYQRKAKGPDGVSPACLKACAVQLSSIFTLIFNRSLELCEVPSASNAPPSSLYPRNQKSQDLMTTDLLL